MRRFLAVIAVGFLAAAGMACGTASKSCAAPSTYRPYTPPPTVRTYTPPTTSFFHPLNPANPISPLSPLNPNGVYRQGEC